MVDQGKLKLDDTIDTFLPDMKYEVQGMKAVVNHDSSFDDSHFGVWRSSRWRSIYIEELQAAAKYAKVEVLFEPGSKWHIVTGSINTAARIVEVVSGISFDQFVDQKYVSPLI